MARIWVKAGINDKGGKPWNPPLRFRVQGQFTDKDTPVLALADGNVVPKINDGSLVRCKAPYLKDPVKVSEKVSEKVPETKKTK